MDKRPTRKQEAARNRNWAIRQLRAYWHLIPPCVTEKRREQLRVGFKHFGRDGVRPMPFEERLGDAVFVHSARDLHDEPLLDRAHIMTSQDEGRSFPTIAFSPIDEIEDVSIGSLFNRLGARRAIFADERGEGFGR